MDMTTAALTAAMDTHLAMGRNEFEIALIINFSKILEFTEQIFNKRLTLLLRQLLSKISDRKIVRAR